VPELQQLPAALSKHAAEKGGAAAPTDVSLYAKVSCKRLAAPSVADCVRGHKGINNRKNGAVSTVEVQGTGSYRIGCNGLGEPVYGGDVRDTWYAQVVAVLSYYNSAGQKLDCAFVRYFTTPEERFGPTMLRPLMWETRGGRPSFAVIDLQAIRSAVCLCPDFQRSTPRSERFLVNNLINPFPEDMLPLNAQPYLINRVQAGLAEDSEEEYA
jgi:hypothetical protein